ncbi:outer membrane protein assembly factor BamA [Oleiphilus sp. HI0009]|nr:MULTISPECIES: outer membrane protein assembly factor BamA [unclassified Oleiphilus]KZX78967.1 outer membrane protein assembly factor BamA [Oleiphilus sp. HI0009]KZY66017.1 outer membrane protein assembly factor BamA [Oleiphilus sp. HI0066]KZY67678.1 outer membrane protein assembly factor BamA [Oleiphilus sp. HI0067]MCH2159440.1 outer membrane protein assembly factor BamA [Oleiphilaceae bacterium]
MNSISWYPAFFALAIGMVLAFSVNAKSFQVEDIQVEGLQRVSAGTVFSSFPIAVGEEVDTMKLSEASRSLFQTGLFTDIKLLVDDRDLIVSLVERPSIAKIEIEGNKDIAAEDLLEGLKQAGMSEGQVFKRVTLERLELEILRSYVTQGRYSASVDAEVEVLEQNRVNININIEEGEVSSILHINIVGNDAFSDESLIDLMELKTPTFWSFVTSDDKYSREKLSGDIERIRSYYLDSGYIKFTIDSTQVSISQDSKDVFITINVTEGPLFTVRDFQLKGELILEKEELEKLVLVKEGDTFSRQKLTLSADNISRALGGEGYTYASVNPIPEPHDDNSASIVFYVDPGKRNYVRRINFRGNTTTKDEVLRQEMVQIEGASASTDLIEASKTKLSRLGYFANVTVDTPAVPGVNDQIDVNYSVEEQSSGNLSASLGFSQGSGITLGLSVSENNFFGTGKRVSFGVNTSESVKSANFSYLNPYYTVDGVSRGFSIFARETDFDESNRSDYVLDSTGASVTFGYPIDPVSRLSFGVGYNHTSLSVGDLPALEIDRFIQKYGDSFNNYELDGGWSRSTLNRGMFPTAGWRQGLSASITVPGSDLSFYKVRYNSNFYVPLSSQHDFVFRMRNELAYGGAYGDTDQMPFYEHYYAGGINSVRGYENNSLGPKTTEQFQFATADPFGGDLLVENSFELIFPLPFIKDQSSMRMAYFVDTGNVFDTARGYDFAFEEIRWSTGLALQWNTFIGPLGFSFGKAMNATPEDEKQFFQFSLGQPF